MGEELKSIMGKCGQQSGWANFHKNQTFYGIAGLIAVFLSGVLLLSYVSFNSLLLGFDEVKSKANDGMKNSIVTESDIKEVDKNPTKMSLDMSQLVNDLNRTSQNINILNRKINEFAASQVDIIETLEIVAESMNDSDELYEIE